MATAGEVAMLVLVAVEALALRPRRPLSAAPRLPHPSLHHASGTLLTELRAPMSVVLAVAVPSRLSVVPTWLRRQRIPNESAPLRAHQR